MAGIDFVWGLEAEGVAGVAIPELCCIAKQMLSRSAAGSGAGDEDFPAWVIGDDLPIVASIRRLAELGYLHVREDAARRQLAVQLSERGISKRFKARWRLERAGRCLISRHALVALEDLTCFELV